MSRILEWWRKDVWRHRSLWTNAIVISLIAGAAGGLMVAFFMGW